MISPFQSHGIVFRSLRSLAMFVLVVVPSLVIATIVSNKSGRDSIYKYEYYYDNTTSSLLACDSVVIVNVGTGMSVDDYTSLSKSIVMGAMQSTTHSSGTIAIIIDSNPGDLKKDDGSKYANTANAIVNDIGEIIPPCAKTNSPLYFIGGHSGGGKGAINAIQMNLLKFPVAGLLGLDPFEISENDSVLIPSMYWGFSTQSCRVVINKAAKAAYNNSNPKYRIFYQVQNKFAFPLTGPHCSFTDNGCLWMCSGKLYGYEWVRTQVGITFQRFVSAVKSNNFAKSQFMINETNVVLFANEENVNVDTASRKVFQPQLHRSS
jgi:hypothetical protein